MKRKDNTTGEKQQFSVIPKPRWFEITGRKFGLSFRPLPEQLSSWELTEKIISNHDEFKIPLFQCLLKEWSVNHGGLPVEFVREQGYALSVSEGKITIGSDTRGAYYNGIHTLSQLLVQADGFLPDMRIIDWPDMGTRCAHICYHLAMDWMPESVPNFNSLKELIKKLASFKYNAVLLEIESMFPYRINPRISSSSAFSENQIKDICGLCEALGIEIIPLLQCLGHAYSVLRLPEYAHLRETIDTTQQYCPANPDVIPLYMKLAGELAERFGNVKRFHIGGDESRRLGVCPECKQTASRKGIGAVYGRHVGRAAKNLINQGIIPLVWSDMFEHYPEALEYLPEETEIVYWKYCLPNNNNGVNFQNFNEYLTWAAPGVRFGTSNHTMYKFNSAMQGISFLAGEAKRMNCRHWLVTDWMKGIPYELSLIGLAYAAEEGWSGGRSMDDFSNCYTDIVFGADSRDWWKVYSKLEIILPYCEDAQARLNDRLDRYDLSGLTFRERMAKYTMTESREYIRGIMKCGLKSAEAAEKIINSMKKRFRRNSHEWRILLLSAETNSHKARLGLAIDEAVRLLKFPSPDGKSRSKKLAGEFEFLITEHDELRKKTGSLLGKGMFKKHVRNLLDVKFEPAARGWMKYFRDALFNAGYLPRVLGDETAPRLKNEK